MGGMESHISKGSAFDRRSLWPYFATQMEDTEACPKAGAVDRSEFSQSVSQ